MYQGEILIREMDRLRNKLDRRGLHTLETGSVRNTEDRYQIGDGWSTVTFGFQAEEFGGTAASVDLDVEAAIELLERYGLTHRVALYQGYSIDLLAQFIERQIRYDLILLDSDNDAQLILHEYLLARRLLRGGGTIVVDDVDLESDTVLKGHALVPWLDDHDIEYSIEQRDGGGFSTGMLITR